MQNQYNSMVNRQVELIQYVVTGGVRGYFRTMFTLRQFCKVNKIDVIHAHYSLCGYAAVLSLTKVPIVCSLMGSDLANRKMLPLIRLFATHLWSHTIVKNQKMRQNLSGISMLSIIPNGVDISRFKPSVVEIGTDKTKGSTLKALIFAGSNRPEKNIGLAVDACDLLKDKGVYLDIVSEIASDDVPNYILSADVLLLTSFREGSPNIVKEAMACNVPVVATRVGDIEYLFEGARGYYIAEFDPQDVAAKVLLAIRCKHSCNGRDVIINKGLDAESVAQKVFELYKRVI